jgi:hypothetical protein
LVVVPNWWTPEEAEAAAKRIRESGHEMPTFAEAVYLDLRPYLDANPDYPNLLRSKRPTAARDVDRLTDGACRLFGHETFTLNTAKRLDAWLRKQCEPDKCIEMMTLRSIADALEAANANRGSVNTKSAKDSAKRKRNAAKGGKSDGFERMIAALTAHHQYDNRYCANMDPIKVRAGLEQTYHIGRDTATRFFQECFGDNKGYAKVSVRRIAWRLRLPVPPRRGLA